MENVEDKNPPSNDGFTPLYTAAHKGHFQICKLIIENVKDKNPPNNYGFTPLYIAAREGHFEICKLIIDIVEEKILLTIMDVHRFMQQLRMGILRSTE